MPTEEGERLLTYARRILALEQEARDGFAPIEKTEIVLVVSDNANPAARKLADRLADFCNMVRPSKAA